MPRRWCLGSGDVERLAQIAWDFWPYWWFYGQLTDGGRRARAALEAGGVSGIAEARLAGVVGILAVWRGDRPTATAFLDRSLALFRQLEDTRSAALILVLMALDLWAVDPRRAAGLIAECRPMFAAVGDSWGVALCANVMAWLSPEADEQGHPSPYAREALSVAEASGDDLNLGMALGNLGTQERELGQLEAAREHLAGSIRLLSGVAERYAISSMFESVGQLALDMGDSEQGVKLLGAAAALREWLQAPVPHARASHHEQVLARLRSRIGAAEFERLFALGKTLDYETAVGVALDVCETELPQRAAYAGSTT